MISKNTIEKVFDTARVEEVIGDFVQLKKSGANFKGLSPFTDERSPSFMVSPVKQIWKDFSSGKGGNVVSFVMEHEHLTYPEAIKYLAKKYGIEIEETEQSSEEKQKASERESLFLVSEFARDYFQQQLLETSTGKAIGLSYFKERGFTDETIKKFELGYAQDEWENFTKAALQKTYQLSFLEKTGLSIVKQDKKFDRFKGRVMFPIHSISGRVLGFGGRILKTDKKAAKYLNSPESEIYNKSKILYGLYYAKQSIAKEDNCYLVEGYTDVIQMAQKGIENVVSSSGTALTPDQIRLINRLTKNITVLFDGDDAGLRASLRGIDLILEQGMNVKVCTFPQGEDPDSFARANNPIEIKAYLEENAQDFIQFKASLLVAEAKNDPVKKAELTRDMVVSIAKIPNPIQQEIYIKECSSIMQVSEEVLFSSLAQINAKNQRDSNQQKKRNQKAFEIHKKEDASTNEFPKVNPKEVLEQKIISLLVKHGHEDSLFLDVEIDLNEEHEIVLNEIKIEAKVYEKIFKDLQDDETDFSNPVFKSLKEKLEVELASAGKIEPKGFIQQLSPEEAEVVTNILMEDEKYKLHRWEDMNIIVTDKTKLDPAEVVQSILNLRRLLIHEKVDSYTTNLKDGKVENVQELLKEIMEYKKLEVIIAKRLSRVT
ncbi:DNA primase [Psychroflexus maritimus]|uniref:DNA primase n=1 Tax=Psychroflexus maritimus TaxID=2714865 RepID=A0A967AEM4_9FLAO|nr:DNA primase [Psychroflexus maritimus]NGZ90686.1 DNA primase [Psychroflexus maritimus]